MSDIVERLRGKANGQLVPEGVHIFEAAADEIERLRTERDENDARLFAAMSMLDGATLCGELQKKRDEFHALRAELATAKRDAIEAKQDVRDLLALKSDNERLQAELAELRDVGDRMRDALRGTRHDAGLGAVWDAALEGK